MQFTGMQFSIRNRAVVALGIWLGWGAIVSAMDLRVVTYNIDADSASNGTGSPGAGMTTVLQAIGQHGIAGNVQPPDVLAFQELSWVSSGASPTLQTLVTDLETAFPGSTYAYDPTYDPTDGGLSGNGPSGLIYNTKTVKDLGATVIGSASGSGAPRAPMRYTLQPVAGGSSSQFYLYVQHAKSGSGTSNVNRRNGEAQEVRADAAKLGASADIIYSGDFNWTVGEASYVTLTGSTGTWGSVAQGSDPGYNGGAGLLTESASNLQWRDDAQLVTVPMTNGQGGLQLVPGSYTVFGNNGSTGNTGSVSQFPKNTALNDLSNASTVLYDLTTATDHLPVVADYSFSTGSATIGLSGAQNSTIITGGTGTLGATVTNTAASGANNLNYTFGAAIKSGSATLGTITPGSTGSLAPSSSQTCAVSATSTNLGVNTITFTASDPNASNTPQTVNTTLTVLDHALGSAAISLDNGGLVHAGAVGLTATVSLGNAPGTRSSLQVSSAPTISGGSLGASPATPYYVAPGSAQTYTISFNAGSTPGPFNESATFTLVGDNQSLPGANSLGSLTTSVTGNVYSGQAEWNTASGTWGTSTWKDTVGGGPSAAPGLASFATDTATFGAAASSGVATVALNSAAPVLSNLLFSNSNASYRIVPGAGTTSLTLTGTDTNSLAAVTVISGSHSVEVPILLASDLVVSSSGSLMLSGSLGDGGLVRSLTLKGSGVLVLSGTGSYTGGTVVDSGKLILDGSTAVANGTSLTVGAAATSIFGSTLADVRDVSLSPALNAVPEPSTFVLLCAGAIGLLICAPRKQPSAS